jgi:hypothetical protein
VLVVSGLGAIGLYDIAEAAMRPDRTEQGEPSVVPRRRFAPPATTGPHNGHDSAHREPVGAR